MLRFITLYCCALLVLTGCYHESEILMAEDLDWKIYRIDDADGQTLYALDKDIGEERELLKTHPKSNLFGCLSYEYNTLVHKDSLHRIDKVTILPWPNDTLHLVVEHCRDMGNQNTHSFIFNEKSDSLICLPTSSGLIGITYEKMLLVMHSYDYYPMGGKFDVISVYDYNGQLIGTMSTE